jgi:hypothetical protein
MRPFLRFASRLVVILALASGGWAQGGFTFLTIDVPGATDTSASGINILGQIVGTYTDSREIQHGFVTPSVPESSRRWSSPASVLSFWTALARCRRASCVGMDRTDGGRSDV